MKKNCLEFQIYVCKYGFFYIFPSIFKTLWKQYFISIKGPLARTFQYPLSVGFCGMSPFLSQMPGEEVFSISLNVRG